MTTATATEIAPLLTIRVKGKPISVNRMYRQSRWGGKYLAPEAVAWQGTVWAAAWEARMGVAKHRYPLIFPPDATYHVICTFYHIRKNADADNLLKLTLDGLKSGLKIDDKRFRPVEAHIAADNRQPQGVCIEVYANA